MDAPFDSPTLSWWATAIYAFSFWSPTDDIFFQKIKDERRQRLHKPHSNKLSVPLRTQSVGTPIRTVSIATSLYLGGNRGVTHDRSRASSNLGGHGPLLRPSFSSPNEQQLQEESETVKHVIGTVGTQFPASSADSKSSDVRSPEAPSPEEASDDIKDRGEEIKFVLSKVEAANLAV